MAKAEEHRGEVTFPSQNFKITAEERMRALAGGPPAFALRLRRIEDLKAAIVRALAEHQARMGAPLAEAALPYTVKHELATLTRLIDAHNRYYPIEARLPRDIRTGKLVNWGELWTPMPEVTVEALLAAASAASAQKGRGR